VDHSPLKSLRSAGAFSNRCFSSTFTPLLTLYAGDLIGKAVGSDEAGLLIEANLGQGVVAVPLSKYRSFKTRICRPVGLTDAEKKQVICFAAARIGRKYDTRHVFDLARYLCPTPPVPVRWRRRMIALGSGDPTRTICSTLIAQAFHSVPYPLLPRIERIPEQQRIESAYARDEILHIRHHSLFAPRDFDLSPYFQIVKPTIGTAFDPHKLTWADPQTQGSGGGSPQRQRAFVAG
jgi:hypothetical protein